METEQAIQQQVMPTKRIHGVRLSPVTIVATGLGMVLLISAIWVAGGFRVIRSTFGFLGGETIFVDSHTKSFGLAGPGDQITVSFKLANRGRGPIRIVGCQKTCSFMLTDELPFVLRPNESRHFTLSITVPKTRQIDSVVTRKFALTLFTSNPAQFKIPLTVSGEVRSKPSTSSSRL